MSLKDKFARLGSIIGSGLDKGIEGAKFAADKAREYQLKEKLVAGSKVVGDQLAAGSEYLVVKGQAIKAAVTADSVDVLEVVDDGKTKRVVNIRHLIKEEKKPSTLAEVQNLADINTVVGEEMIKVVKAEIVDEPPATRRARRR